jgi:hypothetical protein
MKDLPCDLYGSNYCRKSFVQENDILQTNQLKRLHIRGKERTAALRAASEAPCTAIPQSAYSKVILIWIGQNEEKAAPS